MPLELRQAQVTIVGLGLMGGSLAAALKARRACRRVVGVGRREETVSQALDAGLLDEGTCDLARGVRHADMVVLATPVRTIIQLVTEIGPLLRAGCVLTDLGSTKQAIVQAMQSLPAQVQPLGGHPMCGKETSGLSAADPLLYAGARYVLTPLACTHQDTLDLVGQMVLAVGSEALLLDAARHDLLVAGVSHLPYLAAICQVANAQDLGDETAWELAASGFRDSTRLAAGEETMMLDILLTNRAAVSHVLSLLQARLEELCHLLEAGDESGLQSMIGDAAQQRRRLAL
jgi:prephenate dehydrogenase